ncbi:ATP-binding protein [Ferroacidibacillus organovorans]|uniref:Helicase HerA central domain-containing protein n=1 Tax=Ferroacidibacillus organovorans TaxID=1765683 RepID=A0A1V4EVU1_9BACL|nr:ATP-binding protein [Ferroacidibacillus organovorans]OPG16960.1 hypothetical protein B2M26_03895 [Ferroacidibacillus organovorans]
MSIFAFNEEQSIGEVRGVDTSRVEVRVYPPDKLLKARVGRLVAIQGQDANEWLIGMINRVWRDSVESQIVSGEDDFAPPPEQNTIQVTLIGTYLAKYGEKDDHFTRAVVSLPDINRFVFPIEGNSLEAFMSIVGYVNGDPNFRPLHIGTYALDRKAKAFLNADKLFQRHAALLGSTGSGKSWTVATILEQANTLQSSNVVLFDLHGEYTKLPYAQQLRIAGPGDLAEPGENVLFLPHWLLTFEEIQSLIVDYSEQSAPNQSMAVLESVIRAKSETIESLGMQDLLELFTVDSPVPYPVYRLVQLLTDKNEEETSTGEFYVQGDKKGQPKTKQGPLHDKLTRLLIRLQNKLDDRRYGFLFQAPDSYQQYESLYKITETLMGHRGISGYERSGIKVVDFSEVPSDVLPIIVSLVARLIYQIQVWTEPGENNTGRHPILLVCDEAHLYLPNSSGGISALERKSLENFERIAKEGRKYGVGLLVVSQRPSDVSTTILSQCNNIISLRLTNDRDKSVVTSLLPDSLGGILDILPGLEVGEAVVVGDATLLPTRILLNRPKHPPLSSTIDFWSRWNADGEENTLRQAVENLRRQGRS